MKQLFVLILTIFGLAVSAPAQTTQPAASTAPQLTGWPLVVNQFAASLAAGNRDDLAILADPQVVVHRIKASADTDDASRLFARVSRETVLGVHPYFYPPLSMAADISADAKSAAKMSEAEKARMSPPDDASMKQANATAAQWLGDTLAATDSQPVAVILFWCDGNSADKRLGIQSGLVFVLVKGLETDKGGFKITQIAYGNPAPASR